MYLPDADTVALLRSVRERLSASGVVILRESTVPRGGYAAQGEYQAVYRNVDLYRKLFKEAGFDTVAVRRNYAYTAMEIAEQLVEVRRRRLRVFPSDSATLGAITWWLLRGTAPVSFWALPRILARLKIAWPRLQNHFFRLTPS